MNDIQDYIISLLAPLATAFAGWFFGRRKTVAEARSTEIENVEKSLSIYRNIITDLEDQMKNLKAQINALETQITNLKRNPKCHDM